MAIIGKIRKHSGIAIIVIGIAMIGFLFMSDQKLGCSRSGRNVDLGVIDGEVISYQDFNNRVDKNIEAQKENAPDQKITDQQTYQIRQSTWTTVVKEIIMSKEYGELGLTVSPDELFDQVQGRQPHRFILQYFKDPATGQYNPAMVVNYLKNLDKMEPKAKDQWLNFEKAIKDDRQETKFNNLVTKGFYTPKAFLKKEYINTARTLKVLAVAGEPNTIPDNAVKLTDDDYKKFYEKNKPYFFVDEAYREVDYVVFEVKPSDIDRKKIAEDVTLLFKDFQSSADALTFTHANSDAKLDTAFTKKGTFPPQLDTLLFAGKPGDIIPPFEFNNAWYMAKLIDMQERPDSMKGSQILLTYAGLGNESIKRTKEEAKNRIDSLLNVLKKNPAQFADAARKYSDYPSAKEDGGDLKWFTDGNPNYEPFFNAGISLKPNEMKVVETRIGYALFLLTEKTKPHPKVKAAVLTRDIEPSNQTFQETYVKASQFAGQNKSPQAFDKAASDKGLQKRSAPNVREMDNYVQGLPAARDMVRWAFAETTKIGDVSPVFDLQGKYAIALLKGVTNKGLQTLDLVKPRIEPSVKQMKKVDMLADNMKKMAASTKDIIGLASQLNAKIDTAMVTLGGYNRSSVGREPELVGKLFWMKRGELQGPLTGTYNAYFVLITDLMEAPAKEDFTYENNQAVQNFSQRAAGAIYSALQKSAKITDNRLKFY